VTWTQIVFGVALVVALLGLAAFTARRQLRVLREGPADPAAGGEEAAHLRRQAWRRLVCGGLMLVLAVLLAGDLLYLEEPAQQLVNRVDAEGREVVDEPEEKQFTNFYVYYVIAFLLVLLALVVVAGYDLWSVRRFGMRQLRRLQADRRAVGPAAPAARAGRVGVAPAARRERGTKLHFPPCPPLPPAAILPLSTWLDTPQGP
jgi:hypothetical protein